MNIRPLVWLGASLAWVIAQGAAVSPGSLRELSTDRPDATESPFTVDAGHVQVEMSAATYTRDNLPGGRVTEWEVAPFNVRIGVSPNWEVGFFITPQLRVTEKVNGVTTKQRGFGDVTLRNKLNLWGNDGGEKAFGVIADLKLPTAANGLGNDKVEGALIFPVTYELGAGWEGGAMTGIEWRYVEAGKYEPVWNNTATVARDLTAATGMFLELTSTAGDGSHVATFNTGITHKLNPDMQLDAGINVGISHAAPNLGFFVGLARRW